MASPRKTPVTALSVPVTVRDQLNRIALDLSAELGWRVSMAAVVSASADVAARHRSELKAALSRTTDSAPPQGGDGS